MCLCEICGETKTAAQTTLKYCKKVLDIRGGSKLLQHHTVFLRIVYSALRFAQLLPFSSHLDLFKKFALSQHVVSHSSYRSLDGASTGLKSTISRITQQSVPFLSAFVLVSLRWIVKPDSIPSYFKKI